MIGNKLKQLKNFEESNSLTRDEFFELKKNLLNFQKKNPYEKENKFNFNILKINYKFMIPAIIALAVALSGGVGLAAQNAEPNDVLYPIKTEINEPLRGFLAIDAEKKAEYLADLLDKRIEEKAKLVEKKDVNAAVGDRLNLNMQKQINKLENLADRLSQKGNEVASANAYSRLASYLDAEGVILNEIIAKTPEIKTDLIKKLAEISEKKENARILSDKSWQNLAVKEITSAEPDKIDSVSVKTELKDIAVSVKNRIKKVGDYFSAINKTISDKFPKGDDRSLTEINAKVEEAKTFIIEAKKYYEGGNFSEAVHSANEAQKILIQVKLLLYSPTTVSTDNEEIVSEKKQESTVADSGARVHLAKVEAYLDTIKKAIIEKRASADSRELTEASDKYEQAKTLFSEAQNLFGAGEFTEAIHKANEAQKLLIQAKVLIFNKEISKTKTEMKKEIIKESVSKSLGKVNMKEVDAEENNDLGSERN